MVDWLHYRLHLLSNLHCSREFDGLPKQVFYLLRNMDEAIMKATNLEMESKLNKKRASFERITSENT